MRAPTNPRILIVTRKTNLGELRQHFATKSQAKFYLKQAEEQLEAQAMDLESLGDIEGAKVRRKAKAAQSGKYGSYLEEEQTYSQTLASLMARLEAFDMPTQVVDRGYLPTFLFNPQDVVVTFGQDGLVANAAKYAVGLPIIGVNPDPRRIDGVLLPFTPQNAIAAVRRVLDGKARMRLVTLGHVQLNDGQKMLAFNDFFIGQRTHQSARYQISTREATETQSSSGVLVATGAGSSGWLSSMYNMARGVAGFLGANLQSPPAMAWEDRRLVFVVREPFVSKRTRASVVAGRIEQEGELMIESLMAQEGVIFSDGIESDFLAFNSGTTATVRVAKEQAKLVVG